MNRKNRIIFCIVAIIVICISLIGFTYGYYYTNIIGNTSEKSVSLNLVNLKMKYDNGSGNIEAYNIVPGEVIVSKTFSVENTGTYDISNYVIYLDEVTNSFVNKEDIVLTLTCATNEGYKCNGTEIIYPDNGKVLAVNDIEVGVTHNYNVEIEYIETYQDQSIDKNKSFTGNIVIKDIRETDNKIATAVGTNYVKLDNALGIKNYRIYGNSVQNGTPTLETPVEIESVGDKSANLFDGELVVPSNLDSNIYRKLELYLDTGSYVFTSSNPLFIQSSNINGVPTGSANRTSVNFEILEAGTYYLQFRLDSKENWDSVETELKVNLNKKYEIPITLSSKNLIEYPYSQTTTTTINGVDFIDNGDGTVTVNGTATANAIFNLRTTRTTVWSGLEPGETYVASISYGSGTTTKEVSLVVNYYPEGSSSYKSWLNANPTKHSTKTIPSDIAGLRVYLLVSSGTTVDNLTLKPQVEKGSVATSYEPYQKPINKSIYLDEPLRCIDNTDLDNCDYIDFASGRVVRKYNKLELSTSALQVDQSGVSDRRFALYLPTLNIPIGNLSYSQYSNYFILKKGNSQPHGYFYISSFLVMQDNDNYWPTLDDFKTFINEKHNSGNPIYFIYKMKTSSEKIIELPSLLKNSGTNIINVNTSLIPSNFVVDYYS